MLFGPNQQPRHWSQTLPQPPLESNPWQTARLLRLETSPAEQLQPPSFAEPVDNNTPAGFLRGIHICAHHPRYAAEHSTSDSSSRRPCCHSPTARTSLIRICAWMDAQLRLRPQCMTVEELREALEEIVQELRPPSSSPTLTACRGASKLALPPTAQPSNWHEWPVGQNASDHPKLLQSHCLHLENSYSELEVHSMPESPAVIVVCCFFSIENLVVGCG